MNPNVRSALLSFVLLGAPLVLSACGSEIAEPAPAAPTGAVLVTANITGATASALDAKGQVATWTVGESKVLPVGTYVLTVRAEGYKDAVQPFEVKADRPVALSVSLEALPARTGGVTVTATPATASLALVDAAGRSTPLRSGEPQAVPAGAYTLRATADGYQEATQPLTVVAGNSVSVNVALASLARPSVAIKSLAVLGGTGTLVVTLGGESASVVRVFVADQIALERPNPGSGDVTLTLDVKNRPIGTYALRVVAVGTSGRTGEALGTLRVETSGPLDPTATGRFVTVDGERLYGGADVTLSVTGEAARWTLPRGVFANGTSSAEGTSVTIPANAANAAVLDGTPVQIDVRRGDQQRTFTLRLDFQGPRVQGPLRVARPLAAPAPLLAGAELGRDAQLVPNVTDASGVGETRVRVFRAGAAVGTSARAVDLPEGTGYTARLTTAIDALGNAANLVGEPDSPTFGVDLTPPVFSNLPQEGQSFTVPNTAATALTVRVDDPSRPGGASGSGVATATSNAGGTLSGNSLTIKNSELRGLPGATAALVLTVKDRAGNTASVTRTIRLVRP